LREIFFTPSRRVAEKAFPKIACLRLCERCFHAKSQRRLSQKLRLCAFARDIFHAKPQSRRGDFLKKIASLRLCERFFTPSRGVAEKAFPKIASLRLCERFFTPSRGVAEKAFPKIASLRLCEILLKSYNFYDPSLFF
jgi:hypothetical protein